MQDWVRSWNESLAVKQGCGQLYTLANQEKKGITEELAGVHGCNTVTARMLEQAAFTNIDNSVGMNSMKYGAYRCSSGT
jgi:hypothetical protein